MVLNVASPSCRLFVDAKKLKSLRADHNKLLSLPAEVDSVGLEELHVQHNLITRLPNDLLRKLNKCVIMLTTTRNVLEPLN